MKMIEALLAELEQEAETTRRQLERVPQQHLTWRPHPKSMSLGQLALHIATVPGNVAEIAAVDVVPTPPTFHQPEAATAAELVPALTESIAKAKRALGGFDDAKMNAMWRLQNNGKDVMAMPRVAVVRAIIEPLVPSSRTASGVPAALERARPVGLRSDGRRESLRGASRSRVTSGGSTEGPPAGGPDFSRRHGPVF
jgi:hypothetical protein